MDAQYTKQWTSDFSRDSLKKYDEKWFVRIEKNIKHRELVEFIKRFHSPSTEWCDFPIGSGRLFNSIHPDPKYTFGYDISDEFLAFSSARGWNCEKKDLNDFDLGRQFDLITCTNALFAFSNNRKIMLNFARHLKPGGLFITDLINKNHIVSTESRCGTYAHDRGYTKSEAYQLANDMGCEVAALMPHDYYDNRETERLFARYKDSVWFSRAYRLLNKAYFNLHLYPLFQALKSRNEIKHVKYLVAFKKKLNS